MNSASDEHRSFASGDREGDFSDSPQTGWACQNAGGGCRSAPGGSAFAHAATEMRTCSSPAISQPPDVRPCISTTIPIRAAACCCAQSSSPCSCVWMPAAIASRSSGCVSGLPWNDLLPLPATTCSREATYEFLGRAILMTRQPASNLSWPPPIYRRRISPAAVTQKRSPLANIVLPLASFRCVSGRKKGCSCGFA